MGGKDSCISPTLWGFRCKDCEICRALFEDIFFWPTAMSKSVAWKWDFDESLKGNKPVRLQNPIQCNDEESDSWAQRVLLMTSKLMDFGFTFQLITCWQDCMSTMLLWPLLAFANKCWLSKKSKLLMDSPCKPSTRSACIFWIVYSEVSITFIYWDRRKKLWPKCSLALSYTHPPFTPLFLVCRFIHRNICTSI